MRLMSMLQVASVAELSGHLISVEQRAFNCDS